MYFERTAAFSKCNYSCPTVKYLQQINIPKATKVSGKFPPGQFPPPPPPGEFPPVSGLGFGLGLG